MTSATQRLDEQGFFWIRSIADDGVPPATVAGRLIVNEDGRSLLELHGALRLPDNQPNIVLRNLNSDSRFVMLRHIERASISLNASGVFESYRCTFVMIARKPFTKLIFEDIRFDLSGLSAWTRIRNLRLMRDDRKAALSYERPDDLVFEDELGCLRLEYFLAAPGSGFFDKIEVKESVYLTYRPAKMIELDDILSLAQKVRDFFIILVGADENLGAPTFDTDDESAQISLLSWPPRERRRVTEWLSCWTSLPQLKSDLGHVFFKWIKKREEFGSGFYLFIGTRRGFGITVEHEFLSYAMGLEAFSRLKYPNLRDEQSSHMKARVDHLLKNFPDDSKWAADKLDYAEEPSLLRRMKILFRNQPLNININRLNKFAVSFYRLRNEIAHYGGPRGNKYPYELFMQKNLYTQSSHFGYLPRDNTIRVRRFGRSNK